MAATSIDRGRRQALELLVACPDGCAEGILFANGFKPDLLLDLLRLGLAYAQAERTVTDGTTKEVTRLQITRGGVGRAGGGGVVSQPRGSILDEPEHWRERAKEARNVAEQLTDPTVRAMMFRIA
jgi:hypothetical protein